MQEVAVKNETHPKKKFEDFALGIGEHKYSNEEIAILATAAGIEKKAQQPVILDLRAQGAFTEYFAIVSASNARQVSAVAEGIRMYFKKHFGVSPLSIDGLETQQWVLLDYGFLFVHVFQQATRDHYALEQLWSKARMVPFHEAEALQMHNEAIELFNQQQL